jgi:hypothetical protein
MYQARRSRKSNYDQSRYAIKDKRAKSNHKPTHYASRKISERAEPPNEMLQDEETSLPNRDVTEPATGISPSRENA